MPDNLAQIGDHVEQRIEKYRTRRLHALSGDPNLHKYDSVWVATVADTAYAALKEIESTEHTCCNERRCDHQFIAAGALDEIREAEGEDGANSR